MGRLLAFQCPEFSRGVALDPAWSQQESILTQVSHLSVRWWFTDPFFCSSSGFGKRTSFNIPVRFFHCIHIHFIVVTLPIGSLVIFCVLKEFSVRSPPFVSSLARFGFFSSFTSYYPGLAVTQMERTSHSTFFTSSRLIVVVAPSKPHHIASASHWPMFSGLKNPKHGRLHRGIYSVLKPPSSLWNVHRTAIAASCWRESLKSTSCWTTHDYGNSASLRQELEIGTWKRWNSEQPSLVSLQG